jgi:hypothetical protein
LSGRASTPAQGARVIAKAALNESKETGVYLGERGQPMQGSVEVRDPKFQDRVVAETHALPLADAHPQGERSVVLFDREAYDLSAGDPAHEGIADVDARQLLQDGVVAVVAQQREPSAEVRRQGSSPEELLARCMSYVLKMVSVQLKE